MKVGIKLWSSNPESYVAEAGFADFVEVLPADAQSIEKFTRHKHEYTVHAPHEYFGFSPAISYEKSKKLLQRALEAAKKLKSSKVIMHPGRVKGELTPESARNATKAVIRLAKEANCDKLILENSTVTEVHNGERMDFIGYSREQLKEILEESGAGLCLDLEHAAVTAHHLGIDYEKLVKGLMKLKPDYFHLSGTKPGKQGAFGHHLSIFNTSFNMEFVKKLLQKAGKPVCLETPIGIEQRRREVEFLKA